MLGDLALDLVTKLKTTSLGNKVGLSSGAKIPDPTMRKSLKPSAWVVHQGYTNVSEANKAQCMIPVIITFIVVLNIDYGTEDALVSSGLDLIEEIISSINGTDPDITTNTTEGWRFDSSSLDQPDPDRLTYDLTFSIKTYFAP